MLNNIIVISLIFGSVSLLSYQALPLVFRRRKNINLSEKTFKNISSRPDYKAFIIFPLGLGFLTLFIMKNPLWAIGGVILGFLIPSIMEKRKVAKYKSRFNSQLIDALMILSSSLKGGLSLVQALEVLVEEMPPPLSSEFSTVISEIKLGIPLEEALEKLTQRMASEELELVVAAILVARETGGDLTKVLFNLVNTIRDRIKLRNTVATLTLQGRIQGAVLSILPIAFVMFVYSNNPHHFDIMLSSTLGRNLLIVALFLQIFGMLLIRKFSKVEV